MPPNRDRTSEIDHSYMEISRDDLMDALTDLEWALDRIGDLDWHMRRAIGGYDHELVRKLAAVGADPNPKSNLDCPLYDMLHRYIRDRTLEGEQILVAMEEALKAGVDPNRVWCNNWRAYDYAVDWGVEEIISLLEKYGADKVGREYI